jgi:hypothetical protein
MRVNLNPYPLQASTSANLSRPLLPATPMDPSHCSAQTSKSSLGKYVSGSRTGSSTSIVRPYLKRLDIREDTPHNTRRPLLTLKLSSTSFLGSVVHDGCSEHPLYTITTTGRSTAVLRRGRTKELSKIADVRWPKNGKTEPGWDGVLVRMCGGRWEAAESVLRPASLTR